MDNSRLISSLKPVIIYLKLLGLLPILIDVKEIKLSSLQIIFGIVTKVFLLIFYFTNPVYYYYEETEEEALDSAAFNFEVISFTLLSSICQFLFLSRSKILLNIILQFFNLSKEIKNQSFYTYVFLIGAGEIIAIVIFNSAYNISYCFFYPGECDSVMNILIRSVQLIGVLTFIGINILFGNILIFCNEVVKVGNEKLKRLGDRNDFLASSVVYFNDAHTLCENVNRCFGPTMIVSTIITLFEFIVGCYFIVGVDCGSECTIAISVWLVPFGVLLWFVLFGCEIVLEEVNI